MLATSSAKSIEEIRSFISRQKETYRTPYEAQPKDRLRQCVFGGSSNTLDFLPLDRAGNRRFLPIMIYPENAEVHILEDEDASRAYLLQVWAEAMTVYRSGHYSMKFSKSIQRQLVEVQKDFMPEDTEAGQIQGLSLIHILLILPLRKRSIISSVRWSDCTSALGTSLFSVSPIR